MLLLADVGGSNSRIALLADCGTLSGVERFSNDDFPSFEALLTVYRDQRKRPAVTGCSIAIAGPVAGGSARLTNRDWVFDLSVLADVLRLKSPAAIHLVNDLTALGYALPNLAPSQTVTIRPAPENRPQNGQAIVVGLGTGFNACVVNKDAIGIVANEAELGHASLSLSVYRSLEAQLGQKAEQFRTNEDLFSGAGLSRLNAALSGGDQKTGAQIMAAFQSGNDKTAQQTINLYARCMGVAARELAFQHLPYGGITFAGSVARNVLGSNAKSVFLKTLCAPAAFDQYIASVPVRLITDDSAALCGVAQFAKRQITSASRDTNAQ